MDQFKIDKFDYNTAENLLSVDEVLSFVKDHEISYGFVTVNNACTCDNADFELYKFYYCLHDDCIHFEFFTGEDEAIEKYDNDDNYDIYEIQIYYCPECSKWCIDYTNI